MPDAYYFHATLYRFTSAAVRHVVAEFSRQMANSAVRCRYDSELHMFNVTCPAEIGASADEALGVIISKYTDALARSKSSELVGTVERFSESTFDGLMLEQEEPPDNRKDIEPTWPSPPAFRPTPFIKHTIRALQDENISYKFFLLKDLPSGMLERSLAPEAESERVLGAGLTLRAVCWDPAKGTHVCCKISLTRPSNNSVDGSELEILRNEDFTPLYDTRDREDLPVPKVHELVVAHHATNTDPWVEEFIEDVSKTRQVSPEEASEAPPDAKKFMARPQYNASAIDAPRFAKKIPHNTRRGSDADESDDSNDADLYAILCAETSAGASNTTAAKEKGFVNNTTCSDAEDSSLHTPFNVKPTLRSAQRTHQDAQLLDDKSASSSREISRTRSGSPSRAGQYVESSSQLATAHYDQWATYGSTFTKVDTLGLTSSAMHQAQWELRHPPPKPPKANKRGIARRTSKCPLAASEQANPSEGTASITELSHNLRTAKSGSTRPTHAQKKPGAERPVWETTTVQNAVPTTSSIEVPSGTTPSTTILRSDTAINTTQLWPKLPGRTTYPMRVLGQTPTVVSYINPDEPLIDLNDDEVPHADSTVNTSSLASPNSDDDVKVLSPLTAGIDRAIGDQIPHEILASQTHTADARKYTMHQQTSKKGKGNPKGKNAVVNTSQVQLPLPDPVPQPRANSSSSGTKKENKGKGPAPTEAMEDHTSNMSLLRNRIAEHAKKPRGSKQFFSIISLLNSIGIPQDTTSMVLDIQFGYVLCLIPKNSCGKELLAPADYKALMDELASEVRTQFYPRMSTCDRDAHYLLGLFNEKAPARASVEYEIHVKDCQGVARVIQFEQANRERFTVRRLDTRIGMTYMLYPDHTWDTQVSVDVPIFDENPVVHHAVSQFLLSVETTVDPPSFTAMVPQELFTIDHVYVRRLFSKTIDGIEARVTQVRDLRLGHMDGSKHNFSATATSTADMISHQRLWWECTLRIPDPLHFDGGELVRLQEAIDELVSRMDCVGLDNKGPCVRQEEVDSKGSVVKVPFW